MLKIQNDTAEIYLESLNVNIEVMGNIATTVTKMTFYNPNDRILEGELNFPLSESQDVIRFAMDVDGKLREGVAVEKNLGRRAFEGVVRQAIDPGLLEKTVGNNYKARVYPIPANGRKTILIGYEEELKNTTAPLYQLIMAYGKVKEFNLKIEVLNQQFEPKVKQNELATFSFKKWKSAFIAETKEKDFNASGILSFEIPTVIEEKVYVHVAEESDFFYITLNPIITKIEKKKPSSLAILWDVSGSSTKRDTSKEFDLIRNYLKILSNIDVHLIRFSNEIHDERDFYISEGNADELIRFLSNSIYDGGTSYTSLRLQELDYDELLLFTDGISTLDRLNDFDQMHVTHVVNSSASNDSGFLRYLTRSTGGSYIDLLGNTIEEATESLTHVEYQFINASYDHRNIEEVYPSAPVTLKQNAPFSITGKIKSAKPTAITLNFGMQGKVIESREVVIRRDAYSSSIDRMWANKKVEELLNHPESNQDEIVKLGKAYNLVTPFTSLIVLDRVEDYVTYGIEPPIELRSEYERLLAQQVKQQASEKEDIIAILLDDYEDRLIWWKENQHDSSVYVPKVEGSNQPQNPENTDNESITDQESDPGNEAVEENINQENPDVEVFLNQLSVDTTIYNRVIEGQVTDERGEPLPGVNILIKGTTVGTIANLEGRYIIRVRENDILVVSYVGYAAQEMPIGANSALDIVLEEDVQHLSEVVVTALDVERVSHSLSYAVTQVQGTTSGIQIERENQGSLVIRGGSTVKVGPNPLYILDGEVSSEDEVNWLHPDEIASTNVIKGENATSIYGSQASNGVIVIMSKDALEEELELPDSIVSMFEPDFVIKEWNPDEPYLDSLKATPENQQYGMYLQFREQYRKAPSFYLSVGNFFILSKREELA
ncbi:VIT and vWA domain-containing protein [Catalinimonas niigatensis]|uniref:VIT and vWA domain-containing protein n=1 Tax=Catalinimonas niigatensis TaxID=1397264 RepID=UPI002665A190|nr:VIT domain-containing protein [Catalinimonas niigatensis]WPP51765.1 VIT domain-containing protein [Catalinimonas niigatensis]